MDYKQSDEVGTSWQRCNNLGVINPLAGDTTLLPGQPTIPTIFFSEEKVINLGGETIRKPAGGCQKEFNATDVIPLLNPSTNEPLGTTATHQDLYVLLYSLYMQTALERDAANGIE
jgi:hypothetical protein